MPLALAGSLTAVQFRLPAELPLNLNKIEHFSKVPPVLGLEEQNEGVQRRKKEGLQFRWA
jgi:hypothetical protein